MDPALSKKDAARAVHPVPSAVGEAVAAGAGGICRRCSKYWTPALQRMSTAPLVVARTALMELAEKLRRPPAPSSACRRHPECRRPPRRKIDVRRACATNLLLSSPPWATVVRLQVAAEWCHHGHRAADLPKPRCQLVARPKRLQPQVAVSGAALNVIPGAATRSPVDIQDSPPARSRNHRNPALGRPVTIAP